MKQIFWHDVGRDNLKILFAVCISIKKLLFLSWILDESYFWNNFLWSRFQSNNIMLYMFWIWMLIKFKMLQKSNKLLMTYLPTVLKCCTTEFINSKKCIERFYKTLMIAQIICFYNCSYKYKSPKAMKKLEQNILSSKYFSYLIPKTVYLN